MGTVPTRGGWSERGVMEHVYQISSLFFPFSLSGFLGRYHLLLTYSGKTGTVASTSATVNPSFPDGVSTAIESLSPCRPRHAVGIKTKIFA